jgi:YesN/AraC family two-component response regulator
MEQIPDLIITDVMMPGKDGYALCNDLKTNPRTDHIPVIMLTARVAERDRISGYEKGADAYLTKPFNKKELLVRIEQLLKLRKQLQEKYSRLEINNKNKDEPLSPADTFISKIVGIIENNFDKSFFNAADLAAEVHLSESQLYRKLKALTGKSTALFIRTVRLRRAKELLRDSGYSVSEIAYRVGFNDPAWFSRVFKDEFGSSPTEFRKG